MVSACSGFATIQNDRNGRGRHFLFDASNRILMRFPKTRCFVYPTEAIRSLFASKNLARASPGDKTVISMVKNLKPKVAVVILTYNRIEVSKSCILSVLKSKYPNYVVIVVDNASTDGTPDVIKSEFPFIRLIRSDENLGYTGGNNIGISYAIKKEDCDYILILNDDTVVESNLINELVDVAEKWPKTGIASPKTVFFEKPNRLIQAYGNRNFYLGVQSQSLFGKRVPEEIGLVRGTCFLIKKQLIEKIGLMDENFFLYFDEADLSYRVRKAGFRIIYTPSARVYHKRDPRWVSGKITPVVLYYSTRNELIFARKHLNPLLFFPLWIPRFILSLIRCALETRKIEVVTAILEGFIDFTRNKYGKCDPKSSESKHKSVISVEKPKQRA
jgi:GT2 family glycosyltransferase